MSNDLQENSTDERRLSASQMTRFFDLQERDLAVRSEELELRHKEIENERYETEVGVKYARESLEANRLNLQDERKSSLIAKRNQYFLIGFISILVAACVVAAFFLNKDQAAIEIIKGVVFIGAGFLGGYGFASKDKPSPITSESDALED